MEDRLRARHRVSQPGRVEKVDGVVLRGGVVPAVGQIDHRHLVPGEHQLVHHMGADEAAASRYDDTHNCLPTRTRPYTPDTARYTDTTAAST